MAFRFFRRIRIAPGLSLNLSKSGAFVSLGPRGTKLTLGSKGVRKTLGLPGTGLYYTEHDSWEEEPEDAPVESAPQTPPPASVGERLDLGFFQRLMTSRDEITLVEGLKAYIAGDESGALVHFREVSQLADAAYLAGLIALRQQSNEEAIRFLQAAEEQHRSLGRYFEKYGLQVSTSLQITEELFAQIGPTRRGVLLCLVELYQEKRKYRSALDCLRTLRKLDPQDLVVRLSLAELLLEAQPKNKKVQHEVVRLGSGVENESAIHTALLLYKARALRLQGLPEAARQTLTPLLRRKKGRAPELLHAVLFERGLCSENLGDRKKARQDFEKLYALNPDYEGLREHLGL